jgi:RHS repeat-associated protein
VTDDGINKYLYDGEGRLCVEYNRNMSGPITQYIYDAAGNRVAKGTLASSSNISCNPTTNGVTLTNNYILGPGGEQIDEYDGTGSNLVHSNVFGGGRLLATYSGSAWYYAFSDWLGTKRAQITADGNLANLSTFLSLPFGDGQTTNGFDATEHHYTGKERDTESGLDYFGARYYSSAMGRFMSPDWSAKAEPVPYAKLDDPQSLNLYSYVLNNPLVGIDKDGHECEACAQFMDAVHDLISVKTKMGSGVEGSGSILGLKVGYSAGARIETTHHPFSDKSSTSERHDPASG